LVNYEDNVTFARARDFDRWVWLTLRPDGNRLIVDYADECGIRTGGEPLVIDSSTAALSHGNKPDFEGFEILRKMFPHVLVAPEVGSWLREGFSDRGETRPHLLPEGGQHPVPWLLPVFLQPPSVQHALPWEAWVESLLLFSPDLAERCVVMRGIPLPPSKLLQLPMKLEGVGSAAVALLEDVRNRKWFAQNKAVREQGLRLIPLDSAQYDGSDIVLRSLGEALPDWIGRRGHNKPRLVVSIAGENPWLHRTNVPQLEPEMSHVLIMPTGHRFDVSAAKIVTHVVYALVHDFSLHEIAWIIRKFVPGAIAWVATDSAANQALRLSSVMREMIDDVRARRPDLKPGLQTLINDFTFESRGLTAMSSFLARATELRPIGISIREPWSSTDGYTSSKPAPPRRADVTIESYDAFGVLTPMCSGQREQALLRGWRYRLRVHIGWPDPDSAVSGAVPDFDMLLPPADGTVRSIEVAVFAKSFELLSPPLRTIELPVQGESAPVHFELRAPQCTGRTDLRIVFYWNNNLVQSFVLEAEVADSCKPMKRMRSRVPVTVKLASAGVLEFNDVAQLRPRALSIALNDDFAPGSHTLMVKGTNWHEEINLNSQEMDQSMDRFRAILQAASPSLSSDFEVSIRKLAALGGAIWNMLAIHNNGEVGVLESLRTGANQVLQFVRHGNGRPFPWQTVYDYKLPQGNAFLNARICFADTPPKRSLNPAEKGCPHCPGEDVVCIEGFWITRHRVELLSEDLANGIANAARSNRASAPTSSPLVLLGVGTPSVVANDLTQSLRKTLDFELGDITPSDAPVVELLWKPERRPAIFVVLSHLLESDVDMNLPARMNAFVSDPESEGANISVPALARLQERGRWEDPQRPIVLLLACQSARKDLGELISLTDTFLASGASAVAGTEWDVTTDTAAKFAKHLIEQTVIASPQVGLGEAIKQFANSSLRSGDISAFIFTVYGSADLTVGRP
jgi:hypothetical protein